MTEEIIYSMNTAFRGEYSVKGYRFGKAEKAACIVGSMRGNEFQQLYTCSMLINKLRGLEEKGAIVANKEILIIPAISNYSMNVGKKHWAPDNTDLNRVFPGNSEGQAPSRIAAAITEKVSGFTYGVQFPSFYLDGEFIPHVRMMETGYQSTSLANLFGLPYVLTGSTRSFDNSTLNYNWQITGTSAFSVYTGATDKLDDTRAKLGVSAVLRFLTRMGIIRYNCHGGYIATVIEEEELVAVKSDVAGFFKQEIETNEEVKRGQELAEIIDPYLGTVISKIIAPTDGIIFFVQNSPVIFQNSVAIKIIRKIHE